MTDNQLSEFARNTLEDIKAQHIVSLDVDHLTELMSYIIIATATSKQHCRSIARHLVETAKENKLEILGVEGMDQSEWVLVDLGGVVVHIMLEDTRNFYEIEKLWDLPKSKSINS